MSSLTTWPTRFALATPLPTTMRRPIFWRLSKILSWGESTGHRLSTKEALRSAAWESREVPPAPKSLDNLDLTVINRPASKTSKGIDVGDYLLAQELNYGVILLGTAPLAKAFSRSRYKSTDATFKICPKGWYQVLLFLAQVNGVFLTCMMAHNFYADFVTFLDISRKF